MIFYGLICRWKIIFKRLINKINKCDDNFIKKVMNYPSKGIILLIFMTSFLTSAYTISVIYFILGLVKEITVFEIPFFIIFYIIPIYAVFLIGHRFVYKPIKYYENKYGKTGLGDKHLKK